MRPGSDRIEDVTFATLGPLRKFESIHRNPEEGVILKTRVVCIGKDSGFTLNQPAGREDYVVESIDEGSDLGRSYTTHFGKLLEAPYSVTRTTFADLLKYPDSNVLSAEPVEREGRSLLEVVIQHGKPEQLLQTRVLFDPAAGWVARQYQVSMMGSPQPNMRVEIEYRDNGVIPPFPKSVMFESGQQRWNCQFEELRAERSDPEEFTLAFYGLEPVVLPTTPREINWTWVFVGLGVASIVAAVLLRMKSNR